MLRYFQETKGSIDYEMYYSGWFMGARFEDVGTGASGGPQAPGAGVCREVCRHSSGSRRRVTARGHTAAAAV
jgi:hypothetical protein